MPKASKKADKQTTQADTRRALVELHAIVNGWTRPQSCASAPPSWWPSDARRVHILAGDAPQS